MTVTASKTGRATSAPEPVRALRDMTGAYAVGTMRTADALASARDLVATLASHPMTLARVEARLALELLRVAVGRSQLRPDPDDRRFQHPAWRHNPACRRALQGYLAWSRALREFIRALRLAPARRQRLLFVAEHVIAAAAPSNAFVLHPQFYENLRATRGRSLLRGLQHLLQDLRYNHGLPRQVDDSAFRLGRNIAATEGAVVFRNEVFELIQYAPRTPEVDSRAVLFCPPQINKYYVLDLSPDKSFIRYTLDAGQQVFTISWRNPTAAQRDWGLDTYVNATCEAIDIAGEICGQQPVKLVGACAGGLTATLALANLAALDEQHKVACLSLLVTVLDTPRAGRMGPVSDETAVAAALSRSLQSGVLDGADMARTFAWMRPNELIWHFFVNNYVLGQEPPAFDVLYWNSDTTRLPARLHADLLAIYRDNALRRGAGVEVDGVEVDMEAIDRDVFVVAGARDHITPWQACYRSMQMFRSNKRFVLGTAGHVQSILCPPDEAGNARYFVNEDYSLDPAAWRRAAREQQGSWWPAWIRWCEAHGGGRESAPTRYGNDIHEPIEAAPGRYVRQT